MFFEGCSGLNTKMILGFILFGFVFCSVPIQAQEELPAFHVQAMGNSSDAVINNDKISIHENIKTYDWVGGPNDMTPENGATVFDCDQHVYFYYEVSGMTNNNDNTILDCDYYFQFSTDGGSNWSTHDHFDTYYFGPWENVISMWGHFDPNDVCDKIECAGYLWRLKGTLEDVYANEEIYIYSEAFIFEDVIGPTLQTPYWIGESPVDVEDNLVVYVTAEDNAFVSGIRLRYRINEGPFQYLPSATGWYPTIDPSVTIPISVPIPYSHQETDVSLSAFVTDCQGNIALSPSATVSVVTNENYQTELFAENWESGLDGWLSLGFPSSVLVNSLGIDSSTALDPNGDSWCKSGLLSNVEVVWEPGSLLEFSYKMLANNGIRPDNFSILRCGLADSGLLDSGDCAGEEVDPIFSFHARAQKSPLGLYFTSSMGTETLRENPWTEDGIWHHVSILALGPEGGSIEAIQLVHDSISYHFPITSPMPNVGYLFVDGRSYNVTNIVDNIVFHTGQNIYSASSFPNTELGKTTTQSVSLRNTSDHQITITGAPSSLVGFSFSPSFIDDLASGIVIAPGDSVVTTVNFSPTDIGRMMRTVEFFDSLDGDRIGSLLLIGEGVPVVPGNNIIYEDWDNGFARWQTWGFPQPSLLETEGYEDGYGVDPNGDGWCGSGTWCRDMFAWLPGTQIEYIFMTNTELEQRQMYHQSVGLGLTDGLPNTDSQYCSYDAVHTLLNHYTHPNTSGEYHGLSISGYSTSFIDESYPEDNDGIWHHVRIQALGQEGAEVDSLAFVMDGQRMVFDISEAVIPDTVAVVIQGRSFGMTNSFDKIRVAPQPGVHGSLVLSAEIPSGTYVLSLVNESSTIRTIQLTEQLTGSFGFSQSFSDSLLNGVEMAPGQNYKTYVNYLPISGANLGNFFEFHDPETGDITGSVFLRGSDDSEILDWSFQTNFDETGIIDSQNPDPIVVSNSSFANIEQLYITVGKGGELNLETYLMESNGGIEEEFTFMFPDDLIGSQGFRWRLTPVIDGYNLNTIDSWHHVRVQLDGLVFDEPIASDKYKLFSIPVELESGQFINTLFDDLGNPDHEQWRLFRFNTTTGVYTEQGAGEYFPFVQGESYWIIVGGELTPYVSPDLCLSTPTDSSFELELAPGWNLIGNPFAFPVAWASATVNDTIMSDQSTLDGPHWWDFDELEYTRDNQILIPFAGCWVMNHGVTSVTLAIPPISSESNETKCNQCPNPDGLDWRLSIAARSANAHDTNNFIGVSTNSRKNWDSNDHSEPPFAPGNAIGLAFPHDDWPVYGGRFTSDIRQASSYDGDKIDNDFPDSWWYFDVAKSFAIAGVADVVELEFPNLEDLPLGYQAILMDLELDKIIPLGQQTTYTFHQGRREPVERIADCRFTIFVGPMSDFDPSDALIEPVQPKTCIRTCYPNPFNPNVLIRYEVEKPTLVKLEIFDIAGRRVRSLYHDEQNSGVHEVIWNGRDDRGSVASAGQYFCRLSTKAGVSMTRKITLLK